MSNVRVATRYASALMELTNEQKKSNAIAEDLLIVKNAVDSSRELRNVLASPVIKKDKKQAILRDMFKKKISEVVLGYIDEIVVKGRENILGEILAQYFVLRDEQLGIVRVSVKTSVEFSTKQENELVKQLEAMTKKKIEIAFSLDKTLKGGFIARVGDTVLDGSIKRQLEILKIKLKQGSFNN
ncbi:MAG TPA: ATP synthase F1 subunit delta [Bacteroidetes bacterium]|nr:ATP synthase F1 subunit delta [Bacteroidota bacterium]